MDKAQFLSGRELIDEEMPFTDGEQIARRPGIGEGPFCRRCGNSEHFAAHPCSRCGQMCLYCRCCLQMGKVSACTTLYRWAGERPVHPAQAGQLEWRGQLSAGQEAASIAVEQAMRSGRDHLVWAVAGAGKTEVLFRGISSALAAGKRVCVAAPRADVIRELGPRLANAFPYASPSILYGGSPDRDRYSPLVAATTHQLLRFFQAFDVMIIDEVDAFPYTFDSSLQYAAQKARAPRSALIYLTATPDPSFQSQIKAGTLSVSMIPARYHRRPLPVPAAAWCGNWRKTLAPKQVLRWAQAKPKAFIFYPHIDSMQRALPLFQKINPQTESVHAEDALRKEKVEAMRRGELSLLLTTTILERGVTFPGIDVAVVGAEDRIFTESALVQIAGRAGRSAAHPGGDVQFFHYGQTSAIKRAIRQINKMNRLGKEAGLIDE